MNKGFSVIEVVLAAALFMLFSTSAVGVVLQGFNANRLGAEETIANQFAAEGIEAVKSIKNQAYSNLVNSTGIGVTRISNVWAFSGTNNILTHNSTDNYTRVIKVESVNRDGSGNIVASGGTLDPDTKKITSTVSWNFNSARPESVVLSSYLSDWRKAVPRGGIIVYGDATTTPKTRSYDVATNIFSAQFPTIAGASGLSFQIKTSPTRLEAIAGYVTSEAINNLHIMCYNGTSWANEWTATVGGTGTTRRFDIAYETNTGNVIVLYSTNAGTTNELAYRTKAGTKTCGSSNWSSATNFDPVRTSGIVQWVKLASDRRSTSNLIAALWADAASDLSGAIWNGSSWVNEPTAVLEATLEFASTAQDVDSFDIEYESLSGDVMVVWSTTGSGATNLLKYKTCNGGTSTCTWGTTTNIPTVADAGTNLDISANPNSDEIVMGAIDNGSGDLSIAYWSGTAWSGFANQDTSTATPVAGSKLVATGWLLAGASCPPTCTTRYALVYNDSGATNINGYVGGPTFTNAPTKQSNWFTPAPLFGNPQKWYDIQTDPFNKEQLMFTLSDVSGANNRLFAKKLTMSSSGSFTSPNGWTEPDRNSPGGAPLQANLGQAIASPFSFAYWREP